MFTQTLRTFPMLTQLYYADFTQIIYAIHYAFYAVITQIIYADFTQIIYAIHYAVYAIHLRRHIYAITIISLRRLRKYRFHYASLRKGQLKLLMPGPAVSESASLSGPRPTCTVQLKSPSQ